MSNSDIETIFAELLVGMKSLLSPELDRFISQRSVYKSAVSTRNNLEHERLTGEITVQDEMDYEAALQGVEEAKARLESMESAYIDKAIQTGWYKKFEGQTEPQKEELEALFEEYFQKEHDTDTDKEETPAPSTNIPEPSVDSK